MSDQSYFEKTAEIEDRAASFYDDVYHSYQVFYAVYKTRLSKDIRKLWTTFPGDILDVGCGTGYLLRLLKSLGIPEEHIYGLDLSEEMIKQAKESLISSHFFVCPVESFSANKRFSMIVFSGSLHHIRDKKRAIEKLYGVLDDGGFFVISEPNSRWIIRNNAFLFTVLRLLNPLYVYFRLKNRKKIEEIREAGNSIGTHLYHDDASLDELERIAADLDFEYKSFSTDHLFSRLFEGVCINNKPFANIVESLDHYAFRRIFKKHGGSIKAVMRKPLSA